MKRVVLFLLALVLVVALPACGGGEDETAEPETVEGTLPTETGGGAGGEGDAEAGKEVFASAGCGGCHVLSDAGSTGTIGPNLDDTTLDEAAIATQVRNGGGGMPAFGDRLSDQEIADVSAYVASAAGS